MQLWYSYEKLVRKITYARERETSFTQMMEVALSLVP